MTTESDKVTGGCLCGEIRYESDEPPYLVGYCHCKTCQKGIGNLFGTSAFFRAAHFRYVKGLPSWFSFTSRGRRGFCSQCGSPIAFQRLDAKGNPEDYHSIWLGTLDQPEAYEPTVYWHSESKISWVEMDSKLQDAMPTGNSTRYDLTGESI